MTEPHTKALKQSVVAWYGEKSGAFAAWLEALHDECRRLLGASFTASPLERVHATLLDISRDALGDNLAFLELRAERVRCDLDALEASLVAALQEPLRVRFGGARPEDDECTSRGLPRRQRRFSLQADKAVLIGWPDGDHRRLGRLRIDCEKHGFLHRYHERATDEPDCDCYARLGLFERGDAMDSERLMTVEDGVRSWLERNEITVALSASDLVVATYEDEALPAETTTTRTLRAGY